MVLTGTEVKAAKAGKVQLRDAYAMVDNNEAWLHQRPHQRIQPWQPREPSRRCGRASSCCTAAKSTSSSSATREKGLSLIPTRMYLKNGRIKCEIALAKGKKFHDKREAERAKSDEAEARDAIRASKATIVLKR